MAQRNNNNKDCDKDSSNKKSSNVASTIFGTILAGAAIGIAAYVGYEVCLFNILVGQVNLNCLLTDFILFLQDL
jgi:hypothetical protein